MSEKKDDFELNEFINALTEQVAASAGEIITSTVKKELTSTLNKALKEG